MTLSPSTIRITRRSQDAERPRSWLSNLEPAIPNSMQEALARLKTSKHDRNRDLILNFRPRDLSEIQKVTLILSTDVEYLKFISKTFANFQRDLHTGEEHLLAAYPKIRPIFGRANEIQQTVSLHLNYPGPQPWWQIESGETKGMTTWEAKRMRVANRIVLSRLLLGQLERGSSWFRDLHRNNLPSGDMSARSMAKFLVERVFGIDEKAERVIFDDLVEGEIFEQQLEQQLLFKPDQECGQEEDILNEGNNKEIDEWLRDVDIATANGKINVDLVLEERSTMSDSGPDDGDRADIITISNKHPDQRTYKGPEMNEDEITWILLYTGRTKHDLKLLQARFEYWYIHEEDYIRHLGYCVNLADYVTQKSGTILLQVSLLDSMFRNGQLQVRQEKVYLQEKEAAMEKKREEDKRQQARLLLIQLQPKSDQGNRAVIEDDHGEDSPAASTAVDDDSDDGGDEPAEAVTDIDSAAESDVGSDDCSEN